MTPVYLNPPSSPFSALVDQQTHEDQRLKLFISSSPYNQASASCSLSFPTFFDSLEPQTGTTTTTLSHQSQLYNQKADNPSWHGGASYDDQVCSSSSSLVDQPAAVVLDVSNNKDHIYKFLSTSRTERDEVNLGDHESSKSKNNNNSSVKWKSSKMRLIQKMANPIDHNINAQKFPTTTAQQQQQQQQPLENSDTSSLISNSIRSSCNTTTTSTTAATVRVCSDCNTNTTPLWRSGPRGPKSLCNACGIRQRKARRAMVEAAAAAAANGFIVGSGTADTSSSFMKGKVPNKEEKSRGGTGRHVAQRHKINKKSKLIITDTSTSTSTKSHSTHHHNKRNKLCLKTRFQRVFPQDVAEAAVLLMELSCGLINHSS